MLKNYLKIAWKVLLRRKFFTFVSLFGISFTLLVLMVAASFLDHLYEPAGSGTKLARTMHLMRLKALGEKTSIHSYPSYYYLDRYVRPLKTPEAVSIYSNSFTATSYVHNQKLELQMKFTDAVYWDIMELDFIEGQSYDQNAVDNADHVAVITERAQRQIFGRESGIGKHIETSRGNYRVVGIIPHKDIPAQFAAADIFAPITTSASDMNITRLFSRCSALVLAHDESEFDAIRQEYAARLARAQEDVKGEFHTIECPLMTQDEFLTMFFMGWDDETDSALILAGAALVLVLFMLFPAINLVNINISRIIERSSEIGVRKAFGASSRSLVVQFLVENTVLTLIGGTIAYILALIVLKIITDSGLIPFGSFSPNIRVFLVCLGLALFFGIFSGVLPAYRMSRLHPVDALKGVEA
jgi:putative ABC transport system permease protein